MNPILKLVQQVKDAEGITLAAVIEKVESIRASDLKTKEDVKKVAQALVSLRKEVSAIPLDKEVKKLLQAITDAEKRVSDALSSEVKRLDKKIDTSVAELRQEIDDKIPDVVTITERVNEIEKGLTDEDYQKVLDKVFAQKGDIRDALESLEGDDRLDAKAIKNLPTSMGQMVAGGGSNLSVFSNGALVGSSTRINFTGATVTDEGGRIRVAVTGGGGSVSDEAYGGTWDGVTDEAPSKNAIFDKIESLVLGSGTGDVVGPTGAVDSRIAAFDTTTGKLLKDGGKTIAEVLNTDNHTDGTTNHVFTAADDTKLTGIEALADVTDAGNVGSSIHGATAKTTPVDADTMPLIDSAASNVLKKVTWANIKATIKAYTDTLYAAALGADDNYVTDAEKTKLGHISITQAVDLDALETASHAAVTVADSSEIDLTLTGQQISASIVAGSIDETKLDVSVNASLDLADSALQPAAIGVTVQGYTAALAGTTASFTTADETKLDGIEALADVTDATNVTAAGALMDSELTDITAVKALADAAASDVNTGTSTTMFVTPDALAGSNLGIRYIQVTLNGSTALTTSDVAYFRIPAALGGMNLVSVAASVGTGAAGSSSSGTPTFTVTNVTQTNAAMLSTALTVDANEYTSATAAAAAVIDTANDDVATDDLLKVAVTTAGTGVTYAQVVLGFQLP